MPSTHVLTVVKKSLLLRASVNSFAKSSAKNMETAMSTSSRAMMAAAFVCAFAGVGLRDDCQTKLMQDHTENTELSRLSNASMLGWRNRNNDRTRLWDREGTPALACWKSLDCVLDRETTGFKSTFAGTGLSSLEFERCAPCPLSHLFALPLPSPDAPSAEIEAGAIADNGIRKRPSYQTAHAMRSSSFFACLP